MILPPFSFLEGLPMEPISWQDAYALGMTRYFTGKPCNRGHLTERRISDGKCVQCQNERNKRKYRERPEVRKRALEAARRSEARMTPEKKANRKVWVADYMRAKRALNGAMQVATWRAAKMQRMPSWADKELIAEVYALAQRAQRQKGIRVAVDHIIPLRGKEVSGLHVHNNLQVITLSANAKKSRKFPHLTKREDIP
jgi:hypothetical protein